MNGWAPVGSAPVYAVLRGLRLGFLPRSAGVDIKIAQDLLGHSSRAITYDT